MAAVATVAALIAVSPRVAICRRRIGFLLSHRYCRALAQVVHGRVDATCGTWAIQGVGIAGCVPKRTLSPSAADFTKGGFSDPEPTRRRVRQALTAPGARTKALPLTETA